MKINVLNELQIEEIMNLTEDVIEKTGFRIENKDLVEAAAKSGAQVDEVKGIVRIPGKLQRQMLANVPPSYGIKGIDRKEKIIGSGEQYISAIVTDPWIIDYETLEPRRPCLDDVITNTILSQANRDVAAIGRMDFPVTDHPGPCSSLKALEAHILNHTKHYNVYTANIRDLLLWMDIGQILMQGEPLKKSGLMSVAVAVVSPFVLADFNCRALLEAVRMDFAVIPTVCPMAGTTSPYSMIGTLLQGNVENIYIAILTQMVNPGNPFLYTFGPSVSNMRTGNDLYYTVDKLLWKLAAAEIAKAYHIPASTECGGTLPARYDMQAGAESMMFMLGAVNSGSAVMSGLGSCYNANGLSSEMIIIQTEWLNIARHMTKGINTDEIEESFNSLLEQGIAGNFLVDPLTIKNLRTDEFFKGSLIDTSGGYHENTSLLENAHAKVIKAKQNYVSPVPQYIQDDLERYFRGVYGGKLLKR